MATAQRRIDNAMKPDDSPTEKTMINNIEKLLAGEKIEKDFEKYIPIDVKEYYGNNEKLKSDTGWKIEFEFEETIRETLKWWEKRR